MNYINLSLRSRTKLSLPRSRWCRQRCLPHLVRRRRRHPGIRPYSATRNNLRRSIHRQNHCKEKTLWTRNTDCQRSDQNSQRRIQRKINQNRSTGICKRIIWESRICTEIRTIFRRWDSTYINGIHRIMLWETVIKLVKKFSGCFYIIQCVKNYVKCNK